jgi:hypothetical protein
MVQVDRLKQAAQAAVAECKRRTLARFALPEDRGAVVNVADANVPAGIQYAGGFRSTLVFRRRPFSASRLLQLSCHEGYPGRHLYVLLRERRAVRKGNPEDFLWPFRGVEISEAGAGALTYFRGYERARRAVEAAGSDPDRRWEKYLAFVSTP